jgi:hypothetical protein
MSPAAWETMCAALAVAILMLISAAGGGWLAADHYRPLLDTANSDLATATTGRNNLEALAGEQGRKLGDLVTEGNAREELARQALAKASEEAKPDYAAANRIQQERIGGDDCAAATTVIDQEIFGL